MQPESTAGTANTVIAESVNALANSNPEPTPTMTAYGSSESVHISTQTTPRRHTEVASRNQSTSHSAHQAGQWAVRRRGGVDREVSNTCVTPVVNHAAGTNGEGCSSVQTEGLSFELGMKLGNRKRSLRRRGKRSFAAKVEEVVQKIWTFFSRDDILCNVTYHICTGSSHWTEIGSEGRGGEGSACMNAAWPIGMRFLVVISKNGGSRVVELRCIMLDL
ncbi:hypothetical protein Tco_1540654 [Tanacetum coccineum]